MVQVKFATLTARSGQEAIDRMQAMISAGLASQIRLIVSTRERLEDVGLAELNPYNLTTVPGRTQEHDGVTTVRAKLGMLTLRNAKTLRSHLQRVIAGGGTVTVEQKPNGGPITRPAVSAVLEKLRAFRPASRPTAPAPASGEAPPVQHLPTPPPIALQELASFADVRPSTGKEGVERLGGILASGYQPILSIDSAKSLEEIKSRLDGTGWMCTLIPPDKEEYPKQPLDNTEWKILAVLKDKPKTLPHADALEAILTEMIQGGETSIVIKVMRRR